MISAVGGKVIKKEIPYIDVLTQCGIAYRVFISLNCRSQIKEETVLLSTSLIVKEDSLTLFGFLDKNEQKMFEMLLKINGVGPKVAMAICSTFLPNEFAKIIENKDLNLLKKVPGIGPKSAGVILVQLGGFAIDLDENIPQTTKSHTQTIMALESLGFKKDAITKALQKCSSNTTEDLIKEALKFFQR